MEKQTKHLELTIFSLTKKWPRLLMRSMNKNQKNNIKKQNNTVKSHKPIINQNFI